MDKPDSVDTVQNSRREQRIRMRLPVLPLCGDLLGKVPVQLCECFQISLRMAARDASRVGGSAPGAGTAASNGPKRLPEERETEFVRTLLTPFEPAFFAVYPQSQIVFVSGRDLAGPKASFSPFRK